MYSIFLIFRQHIIPIVLTFLIGIVVLLLFVDVSNSKNFTITKERMNPYILSTQGKTIIKNSNGKTTTLENHQKKDIQADDQIETLENSLATIFWIDGTVTRLGESTSISVLELKNGVGDSTQVDFSISKGKSWSNLSRTLDPESYFKQRFDNGQQVAAVRGTIFEVNIDKGYIRTESHAVEIQNEKGEYLATVPDGKSVSVDDTEKDIDTAILDSVWEQKNIENDIILSQERLRKIQEKLQLLTKKENWIQKIQTYLRSLFGINALNLPITVNSSKSGISLSVDASKLTSKNSQELLAIYEAISTINTSEDTINSKIKLREAILQVIPEKERKSYQEIFSRATLFDIWDAFKNNLPNKSKELQKYLETYTKQSENTEEITRIQESLPMDRIKIFNSRMEEWKKQGFETLSDPDWFAKTFKIDSAGLMNIINNANKMVDQGVNSVTKGSGK